MQSDIEKSNLLLGKSRYISLTSFIALALWLMTTPLALQNWLYVEPLKAKLVDLEVKANSQEGAITTSDSTIFNLRRDFSLVAERSNAPLLVRPILGADVIGSQITFKWEYAEKSVSQKFVLELVSIDGDSISFDVLNPEQKIAHIPSEWLKPGRYFWRIVPGDKLQGRVIPTGPSSYYGDFSFHKSALEKVRATGKMRVGSSPTLKGVFNFVDQHGNLRGFDIDYSKWVVGQIGKRLKKPNLAIEYIDYPWGDLLPALKRNEVDFVISGMTSTRPRELANIGVKFTDGYFQSHQIVIASKPEPNFRYPKSLKNKSIGVVAATTNHGAAMFLSKEGGFSIDSSYNSYADITYALYTGAINYGIVDDVFVRDILNSSVFMVGDNLDVHLKSFYLKNLGRESEKYAIAAVDGPEPDDMFDLIQEVVSSPEGMSVIEGLKEKWGISDKSEAESYNK